MFFIATSRSGVEVTRVGLVAWLDDDGIWWGLIRQGPSPGLGSRLPPAFHLAIRSYCCTVIFRRKVSIDPNDGR